MTFTLAGIPFEDERVSFADWAKMKSEGFPFQLPVLEIKEDDGSSRMLSQSRAILRYIGRIGRFRGKPLYPEDLEQQYYCDEVIEYVEDYRTLVDLFRLAPRFVSAFMAH